MATPEVRANSNTVAPMSVLEAIRTRRSIGRVRPERPPRALIAQLLEAATWAPNHRLTEPWRFIVLAGEARERLGDVMAACCDATMPSAEIERTRAKPLRAPVLIAVAVEPDPNPRTIEIEEVLAGAAAVQNLLLAAHALGLAAQWRTGEAIFAPRIKEFLGLPATAHILGFVYVGYPDAPPPSMRRRPAEEVTRWLGWE